MNFILLKALDEHRIVIENLMQYYIYDFSEYLEYDVCDNGLFAPYDNLNAYWEDGNNKFPYLVKVNDKYVGFVLVKFNRKKEMDYFSIGEFFILKRYRRMGIGKAVASEIFDLYKGHWEVHQRNTNIPAQQFWLYVISDYTKGHFKDYLEDQKRVQTFQT